jgi:hypothetical protein
MYEDFKYFPNITVLKEKKLLKQCGGFDTELFKFNMSYFCLLYFDCLDNPSYQKLTAFIS